ncbi:MAG: hypothetical protein R6T83_06125, partial [Salinibacter sp.]
MTPDDPPARCEAPNSSAGLISAGDADYPGPGTHEFRLRVDYGTCSAIYGNTVSVVIDPVTVGGAVASDRAVCQGSTSGLLTLSGHVGDVQKWQVSFNGGAWSDIANTATTYTSGLLNTAGSYRYRAVVRSGECNQQFSDFATVTVDPPSVGGAVTPDNDVCQGSTSGLMTLGGHTGDVVEWEVSSNGGGSWASIANTSTTYTSSTLDTPDDYWYRAVVQNGVCPPANSAYAVISVEEALDPG